MFIEDEDERQFLEDFDQTYNDLEFKQNNPDWRDDENAASADFPGPSDTENEKEPEFDDDLEWTGNYPANYEAEIARQTAIRNRRLIREKRHFFRAKEARRAEDIKRFEEALNTPFSWSKGNKFSILV